MTDLLVFEGVPLGSVRRDTMAGRSAGIRADPSLTLGVAAHQTVVVLGDEVSGIDVLGGLAVGLEPPPAGRVLTLGTEIATLPRRAQLAFRRKLGYLPAGEGLLQNLTLRDNIRLPLRFGSDFRPRDIEGRVDVILAQLRLKHQADLRPAQANVEDRRRAALGRALAFDPELVILEDPFEGLTERAAGELLEAARGGETAQGGRRTVFLLTPALPTLLRPRVDRTLRLIEGQLEASA